MSEDEKRELMELVQRGDLYRLMLATVRLWAKRYHRRAIRAAVYAIEGDDAEPTRVRVSLSDDAA